MLILSLLVSSLILVYSLIVASRIHIDKLAPVNQSSVLKRRTELSLKSYYDYHSTNKRLYIGLSTCSNVLVHHTIYFNTNLVQSHNHTQTSVPPILP